MSPASSIAQHAIVMGLPADFLIRIRGAYPNGVQWLEELPGLIERAARRWGLTDIQPVSNLSYNFVAFARLPEQGCNAATLEGRGVVLKIGPPNTELASELAALRLFDGRGCCRLLEADDADWAFLLERLLRSSRSRGGTWTRPSVRPRA